MDYEINTGATWEILIPIAAIFLIVLLYNICDFFISNYKKRK